MADLVGIAHMVIRVPDWDQTANWYQHVLGFERRRTRGFSCLVHPGADFILLFRPAQEAHVPSSEPSQRLAHIALHVPSLEALEVWQQELAGKGIDVEIEALEVGASITLHDPNGLEVELFCPALGGALDVTSHRALSERAPGRSG